jgi:hypothetical protein
MLYVVASGMHAQRKAKLKTAEYLANILTRFDYARLLRADVSPHV